LENIFRSPAGTRAPDRGARNLGTQTILGANAGWPARRLTARSRNHAHEIKPFEKTIRAARYPSRGRFLLLEAVLLFIPDRSRGNLWI